MAGCVQEGDAPPIDHRGIGAHVLGDSPGLARGDLFLANVIQQGRLAVIHVAHDRDYGVARFLDAFCLLGLGRLDFLLGVESHVFNGVFKLGSNQGCVIHIEEMIHRRHHAHLHELLDDFAGFEPHRLGEIANGDTLRDPYLTLACRGGRDFGAFLLFAGCRPFLLRLATHSATAARHSIAEGVELAGFADDLLALAPLAAVIGGTALRR